MIVHPAELISFDAVTVRRVEGVAAFRDLTWQIRDGETWAIVGPTGSGKTTLAETIRGQHRVESGSLRWPLLERLRTAGRSIGWPSEVIQMLSFKEESRLFSYGRHYYQQRFNFIEADDDLTLETFLRSGTAATDEALQRVATQLGIDALLALSFIKLSNGQTRRARIAKALLTHPELLILDEPFMGLEVLGRTEVANLLGNLVAVEGGTRLLLITRPDALPEWVTHVLELPGRSLTPPPTLPRSGEGRKILKPDVVGAPILELHNVNVAYDDKPILRDISWTVHAGERWALLGPNGSGKTTLLSLLCGDHPQAYRNDIRLFGQQRGTGESIWDIKRRIGLLSPEMHLYFSEPLTTAQTVATGFHDVLAYRTITGEQERSVHELLDSFGISALAERPFARLSTGEQRLVLLLRALVKQPALLILDEPFQGLDQPTIERARAWLDERLRPDQTLLFVSHYEAEIPRSVQQRLRLNAGSVVARQ